MDSAQARNLALSERFGDIRFLTHDRGSNFTRSCDAIFQATGTTILRTVVQAPRMNATCERIGTLRREILDRVLITARPHQGIAQRVPDCEREVPGVTA